MLPSVGYFSGIPCVFFSDGGCIRPHCHYRHSYHDVVSSDDGQKTQDVRSTSTPNHFSFESNGLELGGWSAGQVTLVSKMVENAVVKALRSDPMTPMPGRSALVKNALEKLLADPEALEMASKAKPSCQVKSAPAYKPTPISKLSTKHIPISFIPEKPYSRAHGNRAPYKHYATKLIGHMSSKTKQGISASESAGKSLKSNSEELNFQKELNHNQGFYGNDAETELAEDCQHTAQMKNATMRCAVPLKKLSESEFKQYNLNKNSRGGSSASKVPSKDRTKSPKSKLNSKNITSSIRDLNQFAVNSTAIQASCESKVRTIPKLKHGQNSIVDSEAAARDGEDMGPAGISKDQFDCCEPPAKKKKAAGGPVNLQVSASADPFSRWMKNKKIRQILGKDKKPKESRGNATLAKPPARIRCHAKITSKKIALAEELPEPKISKRIAHDHDQFRPVPITAEDVKIPSAFRHHFCGAFFEEFKKTMNPDEARRKASEEELQAARNSKTAKTYRNNCSLLVMKYRKGNIDEEKFKRENFTPSSCPDFTYGWSLYKSFSSYLLSESELKDYGFPRAVPNKPNCAFVDKSSRRYSTQQPEKPFHRICANCSVGFQIDKIGFPTTVDDCFYHWGKLRKMHYQGQIVEKFTCCGGSADSAPCEISVYHVWSGRDEDCMEDFVESTKLPSHMEDHQAGIYALDCEMCYTTNGLELARLTVLDLNGLVVFDEVISMKSPVLNYNTRFSGIDARKMASATHTFDDVRNWILDHFYDKTILIGHSLENDLKALKLIHRTIVDTSVTFPHKFGPPNKMSLKHLANVVLELNIQENTDGHDSKEDAATCLKLMMKKIREDSKARKPRVIIGYNGKKK